MKEEKTILLNQIKTRTHDYKKSVKRIKEQSEAILEEQAKTEFKFKESLDILRDVQQ